MAGQPQHVLVQRGGTRLCAAFVELQEAPASPLLSLSGLLRIAAHDFRLELAEGVFSSATVQVIKVLPVNKTNETSLQHSNGYSTRSNLFQSI